MAAQKSWRDPNEWDVGRERLCKQCTDERPRCLFRSWWEKVVDHERRHFRLGGEALEGDPLVSVGHQREPCSALKIAISHLRKSKWETLISLALIWISGTKWKHDFHFENSSSKNSGSKSPQGKSMDRPLLCSFQSLTWNYQTKITLERGPLSF